MIVGLVMAGLMTCSVFAAKKETYTYGTGSNTNSTRVDGYTKKNGTYVSPYERTSPNSTERDNYNTRGNYNPSTGKTGTKTRNK
jgi:hypothetical protein